MKTDQYNMDELATLMQTANAMLDMKAISKEQFLKMMKRKMEEMGYIPRDPLRDIEELVEKACEE